MGETTSENQAGPRPMDQPRIAGDVAVGAACVAAAAVGHLVLVPYGVYVPDSVAGTLDSPAVMPLIMFTALGLLGAVLLGGALQARKLAVVEVGRSAADWRKANGMLAVCAGYLAAVFVVGLPVASAVGLFVALWYFGERRWLLMALVAVVVPAALWLFFVHVVHVSMPPALLELGGFQGTAPGGAWEASA